MIGHEGDEKMNRSIKSGGKKLSGLNVNNGIENRSDLCLSLLIHPLPMKQVSISVGAEQFVWLLGTKKSNAE